MGEHRAQGLEARGDGARAARQVHDQTRAGDTHDAAGERGQGVWRRPWARMSSASPGASRSITSASLRA